MRYGSRSPFTIIVMLVACALPFVVVWFMVPEAGKLIDERQVKGRIVSIATSQLRTTDRRLGGDGVERSMATVELLEGGTVKIMLPNYNSKIGDIIPLRLQIFDNGKKTAFPAPY